ncbi:hypothetical protein EV363DRAFT_1248054 [Boletus edulis]|nr:hypothetical protein EV363DRAFT_1248054 [Boletus edulis]
MEGTETFSMCYNLLRYARSFNFTGWFISRAFNLWPRVYQGASYHCPHNDSPPGADKIAGGTHDTHTYDTRTEDTCMHDIQRPHKGRLTPTRYPRNPLYPCHGTRSRYARGFNFTEWFISRAFNLWFNHILHLTCKFLPTNNQVQLESDNACVQVSQCVNSVEEQCKTSLIMLYF